MRKVKTVQDFIRETTFKPDSTKDDDYFFSAYNSPKPYEESLADIHEIMRFVYDNDKKPNDLFWDFTTNFYHTFIEFDKHIALKVSSIEKYFEPDPPLDIILELESSISPIYYTGSKCAKYLLDKYTDGLSAEEKVFLRKYKETRNKVFEHNLDPNEYPFVIRVFHLSVFSTDSELDMELINYDDKTIECGFIDYYDDNYKLIEICIKYLKSIK